MVNYLIKSSIYLRKKCILIYGFLGLKLLSFVNGVSKNTTFHLLDVISKY